MAAQPAREDDIAPSRDTRATGLTSDDVTVVDWLRARVAARPDAIAVVESNRTVTYRDTAERADRLADALRADGIKADDVVAIALERSADLVVSQIAVLMAGAAYLPLDVEYPKARIAAILDEARPRLGITTARHRLTLPQLDWRVVDGSPGAEATGRPPEKPIATADLAYIIFTSGSAGKPRGAAICHASLTNLVRWHHRAFDTRADDRAMLYSSPGFDASVWETWPYLAAGASLYIPEPDVRLTPAALRDWIVARRITTCFLPTVMAEHLMKLDWPSTTALRTLLTGGETLRRRPPRGLPFTVVNNYGPTEAAVVSTSGVVLAEDEASGLPTIGRAIDNVAIHLLDGAMRPVPDGEAGEIYIGGKGIARGYCHQAALTAERFVRDPFDGDGSARLYRTGDLARQLPGGELEFLGRIDDQVKIDGYRIEPAEIVAVLNRQETVEASVVVPVTDAKGGRALVAYVVPVAGTEPTEAMLRATLATALPAFMIPAAFVLVPALPLTIHGKIDPNALPPPAQSEVRDGPVVARPASLIAARVAGVLAEIFERDQISSDDNFFLLGGHSLLAAQVIRRIFEEFNIELPLRTVFDKPTVTELADEIDRLIAEQDAESHRAQSVT